MNSPMKKLRTLHLLLVAALLLVLAMPALASGAAEQTPESYPSGTVTSIIPWPAGGRTDLAARVWAPFLEEELGVPVVISNMAGAGGVTGSNTLIRARPDGYTFGVLSISLNLSMWNKMPPFEFERLEPVSMIFSAPMTVSVAADSPWQTLDELIAYGRANPGALRHANSGSGTSQHVISAAFFQQAGVEVTHVPYGGDGPAATALATGEVEVAGAPMIAMQPFLDGGDVRILAITGEQRSPLYPDIPTVRELGYDFALESFDGIYLPLNTPRSVIDRLDQAIGRMARRPDFIEAMHRISYEIAYLPTDEFRQYLSVVNPQLEQVVNDLGFRLAP